MTQWALEQHAKEKKVYRWQKCVFGLCWTFLLCVFVVVLHPFVLFLCLLSVHLKCLWSFWDSVQSFSIILHPCFHFVCLLISNIFVCFSVAVLCQLVVVQSANMFHLLHASFKKFPHPLVFIVSSFSLVNVSVISLSPFLVLWMSFLLFLFHLTLQEEISLNTKALRLDLWPADLGSNCSMSVLMSGLGKLCELIRNKTCIY